MRADWIKLMIAAARLPLRSDPANNQFERPGRVWHRQHPPALKDVWNRTTKIA